MSTTLKALYQSNHNFDLRSFENFSFKKDYLNICSDLSLVELLIDFGDTDPLGECLSDVIYIFDKKMKRKRVQIIVTKIGIYLFTKMSKSKTEKKKKTVFTNWKILRKYKLSDLKQVMISSKNYTFAAFVFEKEFDFLMESCRRTEIIAYVSQRMKSDPTLKSMFRILYLNSFDALQSTKGKVTNTSKKKNNKSNSYTKKSKTQGIDFSGEKNSKLRILQETFRNAKLTGYLNLQRTVKKVFGKKKNFKEYFFILTNLGLLYFKKCGVSSFQSIILSFSPKCRLSNQKDSFQ